MKEHENVAHVGDTMICSGTKKMTKPTGVPYMRVVELQLPKFQGEPAVTTTIFSQEGPGNPFAVFELKFNEDLRQTNVAIYSANVQKEEGVDFTYYCSYVAIGKKA